MELSQTTIETVKATIPLLEEQGLAITSRMYEILFEKHPETKELFNGSPEDQPKILLAAIAAYANNIDNIEQLHDKVMYIADTHVKHNVQEEHYPMVGKAILTAMQEVLGELATPDILKAWEEAYFYLAEILLMNEKQLYAFSKVSKVDPIATR